MRKREGVRERGVGSGEGCDEKVMKKVMNCVRYEGSFIMKHVIKWMR